MRRPVRLLAASVAAALAIALTAGAASASSPTAKAKLSGAITVSAAASLTEAFTRIGADFQKRNKGTTVTFNFGSSATLATERPASSADRRESLPSRSPTSTSTPESWRLSAWAWPWLP